MDCGCRRIKMPATYRQPAFLLKLIILTTIYFVAAKLGLMMATLHPSVSPVWPPTGIAIAAILVLGYRAWPAILLGAFLANLLSGAPVGVSIGITLGNTAEALAAGWLMNRFSLHRAFDRLRDVLTICFVATVATMISALIGVTALLLGGRMHWHDVDNVWFTWWLGDSVGALVITPLLLVWSTRSRPWLPERRYVEAAILMTLLFFAVLSMFAGSPQVPLQYYPLVRLI